MTYLRSLSGAGHLIIEGENIGSVDYDIRVYRQRYLKEGRGTMKVDRSVFQRLFQKIAGKSGPVQAPERATLGLEDGTEVTILLGDLGMILQHERLDFVTTGEIPGF